MERTDLEILHAFQKGDELAFVTLYNRHKKGVYLYIAKILGDSRAAEDVFQETFLRIYTKKDTCRRGENASGWIFAIARNLSLNLSREQKRVLEITEDPTTVIPEDLERKEELEFVHREIDRLPVDYREVIVLRDMEGLTYQEIAEITERSLSSVKVTLFRARRILREKLSPLLR